MSLLQPHLNVNEALWNKKDGLSIKTFLAQSSLSSQYNSYTAYNNEDMVSGNSI